jgi:hypothetical protein
MPNQKFICRILRLSQVHAQFTCAACLHLAAVPPK